MLWTADFEVLTLDLDLLENKRLGSFFSRSEVGKSIMAVGRDPAANDGVSALKDLHKELRQIVALSTYANMLAELSERRVKIVHQLLRRVVLGDVADVELAF